MAEKILISISFGVSKNTKNAAAIDTEIPPFGFTCFLFHGGVLY